MPFSFDFQFCTTVKLQLHENHYFIHILVLYRWNWHHWSCITCKCVSLYLVFIKIYIYIYSNTAHPDMSLQVNTAKCHCFLLFCNLWSHANLNMQIFKLHKWKIQDRCERKRFCVCNKLKFGSVLHCFINYTGLQWHKNEMATERGSVKAKDAMGGKMDILWG